MAAADANVAKSIPPVAQTSAAPPAPPVKADAQWECKTAQIDAVGQPAGALDENLTVGTPFLLACQGSDIHLDKARLALEVPKEQKYQLKILQTREVTDARLEFLVTTWTAGDVKLANPVITDGEKRVGLGPIEFKVKSVLDPKTNPESKAFPPWGPAKLPLPIWIWISLGAFIVVIVLIVALRTRIVVARRRFMRKLAKNESALPPYHQFNKELRNMVRQMPHVEEQWTPESAQAYLKDLDHSLKWYLERELLIPVFERRTNDVLNELKTTDKPAYDKLRRELNVVLDELQKAQSSHGRVTLGDAHQITDLSRELATRVKEAKEVAR